jgi:sugar phosphate isomerase/epimerase
MTQLDLLASCWTTAGDAAPLRGDERSPYALLERVQAASAAGFRGFGLVHADLVAAREQYGLTEMRRIFDHYGMAYVELEFLGDWWTTDERRASSDRVRRDLLNAAELLGARQIKVSPDLSDERWDIDHWASEFSALAAEAADAGTRVALEFMPMTNIRTLEPALELVEAADHKAGGLIVDVWHVVRSGTPLASVAEVPRRRLFAVELDDAGAEPVGSLLEDTINHRRLCGEGDFDLPGFVQAIRATGYVGPWGVEIISEEHRRRPLREAVVAAYEATTRQLAGTSQLTWGEQRPDHSPPPGARRARR